MLTEKSKQLLAEQSRFYPVSEKTLARAFANARFEINAPESDLQIMEAACYAAKLVKATSNPNKLFVETLKDQIKMPVIVMKEIITGKEVKLAHQKENERLMKLAEACALNDPEALTQVGVDF
jgi:hypothetical protein